MPKSLRPSLIPYFWLLWLLIGITAILFVPVKAQDDLHYLGIAWNMLKTHSWLLTYSMDDAQHVDLEKTPLLYWLILSLWHSIGISAYSVKALIFLIGTACLWVSYRLALEVFPENKKIAELTLIVLLVNLIWPQYFGGSIRFEGLTTLFGILYLIFLVKNLRSKNNAELLAAGIFLGLCLFSKGGVGLLYYLPLAVLAPYLVQQKMDMTWIFKVVISVVIALVIPALYLLFIYFKVGSQELNYLLFKQISNRIGVQFHLELILGFIGCFLPLLMLFKWQKYQSDPRLWVLLFQIIFAIIFFALFVNQPAKRYLIPICPFVALILAYLLSQIEISERRIQIFALVFGIFIMGCNVSGAFGKSARHNQNLALLAKEVRVLQLQDQPVVQFSNHIVSLNLDFLALLPKTLPIIHDSLQQKQWLQNHPNGYVIADCNPADKVAENCFKLIRNNEVVSYWKDPLKTGFPI